jgi:hypothetical protein
MYVFKKFLGGSDVRTCSGFIANAQQVQEQFDEHARPATDLDETGSVASSSSWKLFLPRCVEVRWSQEDYTISLVSAKFLLSQGYVINVGFLISFIYNICFFYLIFMCVLYMIQYYIDVARGLRRRLLFARYRSRRLQVCPSCRAIFHYVGFLWLYL